MEIEFQNKLEVSWSNNDTMLINMDLGNETAKHAIFEGKIAK